MDLLRYHNSHSRRSKTWLYWVEIWGLLYHAAHSRPLTWLYCDETPFVRAHHSLKRASLVLLWW